MGPRYVTSDEKDTLVTLGTAFTVSNVQAKIGGQYGPEWEISLTLSDGRNLLLSLSSGNASRDAWHDTLADFITENGPQAMKLVQRTSKAGRKFFFLVPAEYEDAVATDPDL